MKKIGDIVILNLTEDQQTKLGGNHDPKTGNVKVAAAIVVAVWSEPCLNLKVIGDSDNNLWVTSSSQGDQPGMWLE